MAYNSQCCPRIMVRLIRVFLVILNLLQQVFVFAAEVSHSTTLNLFKLLALGLC